MNISIFKTFLRIAFAPFLWLLHGCSPLGEPVNDTLSDNHYYSPSKDDIIYSSLGNWLNFGKQKMQADVESFEVLNPFFGRDKNGIFFYGNRVENPDLDVSSFYTKTDSLTSHTGFDKAHVYFLETHKKNNEKVKAKTVEDADPETYVDISFDWAKDRSNHFYKGEKVDITYDSFQILNDHFVRDSSQVFARVYQNFSPLECDQASFRIFKDTKQGIDDNNIYWLAFLSREKKQPVRIPYMNIDEVAYLNNYYLIVGSKVFYDGAVMPGVASENFEVVFNDYAKDEAHVYYEGAILPNADAATFEQRGFIIVDKNGRYEKGEIVGPVPVGPK